MPFSAALFLPCPHALITLRWISTLLAFLARGTLNVKQEHSGVSMDEGTNKDTVIHCTTKYCAAQTTRYTKQTTSLNRIEVHVAADGSTTYSSASSSAKQSLAALGGEVGL